LYVLVALLLELLLELLDEIEAIELGLLLDELVLLTDEILDG
jgi:hypothetical protein